MSQGIYYPDGTFHSFSHENLTSEVANRINAGLFNDMSFWLGQLPDPDPILRKNGQDAQVLGELIADDQVTTCMLARKNRVLNSPCFGFRAGSASGEQADTLSQQAYENLSKDLENTNLRSIMSGILDAPFYGFIPLELIWKASAEQYHLVDVIPRPSHWFCFDNMNNPCFRGEMWGLSDLQPVPAGKFVFVTHHGSYDNPYGLRLLSRCLWPVTFKRGGLKFYATFVERHGSPWVVAKAPSKASDQEKRKIANDLARMVQDCVAALPAGSDVQFLAPSTGQGNLHETFLSRQDKAISKLLMGQTLTLEMEGKNNSQAAATTHEDVAEGLAKLDKAMVEDAFNEIAWLYTQVNYGAHVLAPLFAFDEPEDLISQADLDIKLYNVGVRFKESHFESKYNLKKGEFYVTSEEIPSIAQFSAQLVEQPKLIKNQAAFDAVLEELLPKAIKANKSFITKLENATQNATTFDDLELALIGLLAPKMGVDELEDFLARTMTQASLYGVHSVDKEIGK